MPHNMAKKLKLFGFEFGHRLEAPSVPIPGPGCDKLPSSIKHYRRVCSSVKRTPPALGYDGRRIPRCVENGPRRNAVSITRDGLHQTVVGAPVIVPRNASWHEAD